MVRDYELMYIARPDLDEEGLQGAVDSVEQLVSGAGGSVVRSTSWGRRRLAYEVDHLRDGHYMLLHLRLDGGRVADVERALSIHETVFRHLLVVREGGDDDDSDGAVEPAAAAAAGIRTAAPADDAAPQRQAAVAATADDADGEDEEDDEDDEDDDEPAASLNDDEEEI
jgi:small subunit ribosomal protein S6